MRAACSSLIWYFNFSVAASIGSRFHRFLRVLHQQLVGLRVLLVALPKSLERPPKGFSRCPVPEIDEYFELVAKYGKPLFKWDIIRPAFLWKLEQTISEMFHVEREMMGPEENAEPNINGDEMRLQREFILQKAAEFDGAPFTFQRLCELLLTPLRHYKRTDKYLRALEKTINVVTTITENGERITGVELFPVEENNSPTHGIEQPFFVQ
ncbi:unnamed protein product, partial [Gongylonema pulchrum]|uniref:PPP4R2 n=1 Tax=Gongylonema pulchrum TaxID=637853 RepID=A0A183E8U0_9BILA